MSSYTVSLSGNTSVLTSTFFPEIVLDAGYKYSCGLLDLTTYHSMPNVTSKNNSFTFKSSDGKKFETVKVPIGCYEANDILNYIKSVLVKQKVSFTSMVNKNTLKTKITCDREIDVRTDSILQIFGFKKKSKIVASKEKESEDVIKISQLNIIRVECNIVSGAYINGKPCHAIYEFASNKVDVGYKIIEQPINVIYMPVVPKYIDCIQIKIVDQDGNLVDLRGEEITCRIHIKRDDH